MKFNNFDFIIDMPTAYLKSDYWSDKVFKYSML
jgi:hypothetical protein